MPHLLRKMYGSPAIQGCGIPLRAPLNQAAHHLFAAGVAGKHQGSGAVIRTCSIDVCAALNKELDYLQVARLAGKHQGSGAVIR